MILVTGASEGIGLATAKKLLDSGEDIVVTARNEDKLRRAFHEKNALILPWDLNDIGDYAARVKDKVGEIKGLVHAAGTQITLPINMIKEEKIEAVFRINTYAAMLLVSAFSKKGMYEKGSSFVLISSIAAHEGAFGKTVYAASKAALEGFVVTAAPELAKKGIRINAVAPGVVETPMVKEHFEQMSEEQRESMLSEYLLGMGSPNDVANHIEFLISDRSKWITGQTHIIDGGHLARRC